MSIKRHIKMTICCDGPCGKSISGETPNLPRVPPGWRIINVEAQFGSEQRIVERAALCPDCYAAFKNLLSHFCFSSTNKADRQPHADPTAVRLGAMK